MATSQITETKTIPITLLWQQMRGFRGKYAWAIAALFVFTAINYITPLIASATIDFALEQKPNDNPITTRIRTGTGGAVYCENA